MAFGVSWLDILLIVLFVGFLVSGLRKGLFVTLGGIAGFVAGGVATFFAIPLVSSWVQDAGWRLFWVVATAVVLMLLGHGIGVAIGARIRLGLNFPVLRSFDRVLGGVANVAVAGLVISAIAFSVATMGVPLLSQQIAGSQVIKTIRDVTPDPVTAVMAQARATVMGQTIPELLEPFAPVDDAEAPSTAPSTEALERAGESVVKITGTAFACGVNQTGSGFAAATDRVITNAHVVSGITEPVVNTRDGRALPASVVHFDTATDLAVLAVEGLGLDPIPVGEDLAKGDAGAFLGYPAGGPFRSEGATVQSLRTVMVQNIYGADPSPLEIYQLGAEIEQGNSGGPLLGRDGELAGVVFAKAKGDLAVGYALSLEEVEPVVDRATGYVDPVSTGACSAT